MPKGYWIAHITVTHADAYNEYVRLDTPIVERFGGRFLVRGGQAKVPEAAMFERHVVIEFPDFPTALACYDSPDYQQAAAIRRENSDSQIVLVEGVG